MLMDFTWIPPGFHGVHLVSIWSPLHSCQIWKNCLFHVDSTWTLWVQVEYVDSTWNLWGRVKYSQHHLLWCRLLGPNLIGKTCGNLSWIYNQWSITYHFWNRKESLELWQDDKMCKHDPERDNWKAVITIHYSIQLPYIHVVVIYLWKIDNYNIYQYKSILIRRNR